MEIAVNFIDFFIHLDRYLQLLISNFGIWTYVIIFLIIFCETGLVVTPFLPGDSLLFGLGALAATGALEVELLLMAIPVAAVAGDNVNYTLGKFMDLESFIRKNPVFSRRNISIEPTGFTNGMGEKPSLSRDLFPLCVHFPLLWPG